MLAFDGAGMPRSGECERIRIELRRDMQGSQHDSSITKDFSSDCRLRSKPITTAFHLDGHPIPSAFFRQLNHVTLAAYPMLHATA